MKILVERDQFTDKSTCGKMYIDELFECYTLEDVVRKEKIKGETAIPEGTYKVVLDFSPRFQKNMLHILDVPGFQGIRIHSGNEADDTEGCILVGAMRRPNWVGQSRVSYANLFAKVKHALDDKEEVTIEVRNERN